MIIACDIDNCLNNLQEAVTELLNQRCGTTYTLNDITEYNVENSLPIRYANKMKKMYGETGIYGHVKPIEGAQDALQKLIGNGHQIYLVTDAIPKVYHEKVEWIKLFFPYIDEAHIVAMKHKHLFKCDIMIEDNMQNLISGVHYHRVCLNYPWNRKVHDEAYNIHRCDNWNEIIDVINKLNEEESE